MHFRIHNEGWVYLVVSVILTIIAFPFLYPRIRADLIKTRWLHFADMLYRAHTYTHTHTH